MSFESDFKKDAGKIIKDVNKALNDLAKPLGQFAIRTIQDRTKGRGKDINDILFTKYADSYLPTKERLGTRTSPPDLWVTGFMQKAMIVKAIQPDLFGGLDINIGFANKRAENLAIWHQFGTKTSTGAQKMPARSYFGISAEDQKKIEKEAQEKIDKIDKVFL